MDETHVVTCFLRNRGEVLLLRRSEAVGSYGGRWGGVAGRADGDPDAAARREIAEETGLVEAATLVRRGESLRVADESLDTARLVHPFLFDCSSRAVETNRETAEAEWVPPTEILRRETVPDLWTAYERVAPSVETVANDADHGSAYVSLRALAVLRDRAAALDADATGDEWTTLTGLAEELLAARPSMAALVNRVNRAMADASGERTAAVVEAAAMDGIDRALWADAEAASAAAERVDDAAVLTLSRSGTALDALDAAAEVFVAESRPAREGVDVAERLAADGVDVTLHTDAAVAHVLAEADVDAVLVGADTVLPSGDVVNKTGTRAAALAADREGVPAHVVAASDKIATDDAVALEAGDREAIYDGDAPIEVTNPTFDVTPGALLSGVVTERGVLDPDDVSAAAADLRDLADWRS